MMKIRWNNLTKADVDLLLDNCNLSIVDEELFLLTVKGYSDIQIADKLNISVSNVTYRKKRIRNKIFDFLGDYMVVNVYVNGQKTTKEELKHKEITIEAVKKLIAQKLTVNAQK